MKKRPIPGTRLSTCAAAAACGTLAVLIALTIVLPARADQNLVHREMIETLDAYVVHKMGRHEEAFGKWLALAEKGNAQGILNVGNMLMAGEGVARDEEQAVAWYRKGADQGDPHCLFQLAEAQARGVGMTADPARARALYEEAAGAGSVPAQVWLGQRLLEDKKVNEARIWLSRAADGGDQSALAALATLDPRERAANDVAVTPETDHRLRQLLSELDAAANARDTEWFTRAIAQSAKIRVKLPGQPSFREFNKGEYSELWRSTFARTQRYRLARTSFEIISATSGPVVKSQIVEYLTADGETTVLRLREVLSMAPATSPPSIVAIELEVREEKPAAD